MKKNRDEFLNDMKSQRFGVEIELTGITKQDVREILKRYFNYYELLDFNSREWTVKYDSSIYGHCRRSNGQYVETNATDYRVELVTPILDYDDIPMLQEIVRLIRKAGGIAGAKYRTGIHIHVGAEYQNHSTLRNLIRLMSSKEDLLERALQIPDSRLSEYCQKLDKNLANRCNKKFRNLKELEESWYTYSDRYHMLNLSSLFENKGVELRMFNSTLHAGEVKAFIQFSLALCQTAKDLKRCSSTAPKNKVNDSYAMRCWLNRMHLVGDEFKTCRKFMLKHLTGDSAFSNPLERKDSTNYNEDELPYY